MMGRPENNWSWPGATIGALLKAPYRRIQKRSYGRLAECGHSRITPAHSSVFRNILPGGSRISDMATEAGITKQSMGYLVDSLVQLGYVALRADPEDGRAKLVVLTGQGECVTEELRGMSRELEEKLNGELGPEWLDDLRQKLQELDRFLEAAGS